MELRENSGCSPKKLEEGRAVLGSPSGIHQTSSATPRHHPVPPRCVQPFSLGSSPACPQPHRPAETPCTVAADGDGGPLLGPGGSGTWQIDENQGEEET